MDNNEYRKELGKYFLDVSKLIFGGVVLATILKLENINRALVLGLGLFATLIFAKIGFNYLKKKK